jgi:hypothetical protein
MDISEGGSCGKRQSKFRAGDEGQDFCGNGHDARRAQAVVRKKLPGSSFSGTQRGA